MGSKSNDYFYYCPSGNSFLPSNKTDSESENSSRQCGHSAKRLDF